MSVENFLLERDGVVAVLTVNRPHGLDARNSSTIDRLGRGALDLTRAVVRVVVINGL